jgi:C1A family cysteine protease
MDWRKVNGITEISNQGNCGSCSIFATIADIESKLIVDYGFPYSVKLSTQQVLDCMDGDRCQGSDFVSLAEHYKNTGLTYGYNYPKYLAKKTGCKKWKPDIQVNDYELFSMVNGSLLEAMLQRNTIVVSIVSGDEFKNYKGGIFVAPSYTGDEDDFCYTHVNHAVQLIGYTNSEWIIKNSWGTSWGDGGFGYIQRNSSLIYDSMCIGYQGLRNSNITVLNAYSPPYEYNWALICIYGVLSVIFVVSMSKLFTYIRSKRRIVPVEELV